ncbi:hypothetical protein [Devosia sp. Root436]|uniref:hypothetical protein n=1 Tax=Devosia sp. Root436 TaxID=1736537 RepID=UPI0012E381CC|nr:hypothetical protein [Devosia sp. Root436]
MLAVIVALVVAPLWAWLQARPFPPTAWYGYTLARGDVISFEAGEPIQYTLDMEMGSSQSEFDTYMNRCDPTRLQTSIVGQEYRGLMLCNAARLSELDFAAAARFFKADVDEMYGRYIAEWVWAIGQRLALMLGVILATFLAARAFRWVRAGQPT